MVILKTSPLLLLSLAILCTGATAAPTPVNDEPGFVGAKGLIKDSDLEAMTGPLPSKWVDPSRYVPEWRDQREKSWQNGRVAFRQFSKKAVSTHCLSILEPALDHLDSVRNYVHASLQVKKTYDFLQPVLEPLVQPLLMMDEFHYSVELTDEEFEEEKKRLKEQEEDEKRYPDLSLSPEERKLQEELRNMDMTSKYRSRTWTEESEPQLLLRYRLRELEKAMAIFPYLLKYSPDPVRQALEENGFVQRTQALREDARSLLTCEGVSHVTLSQLKDKVGGFESDNHMERYAAVRTIHILSRHYSARLIFDLAESRMPPRKPIQSAACGLRNVTQVEEPVPAKNAMEDRQQLKDQVVEDSLLFTTPEVEFDWTYEAIARLWKATKDGHQKNPEVATMMFLE